MEAATPVIEPPMDSYQRALTGGPSALALLANAALLAAEACKADQLEGLTIAALFSRMAAETDLMQPAQGHGHMIHAEVMLMREQYDRDHERLAQAVVAGACAIRALNRSADVGNEAAAARLSEIMPKLMPSAATMALEWATASGSDEQEGYDAIIRTAARGDPEALIAIMNEARIDQSTGILTPIETLTIVEQCGRLGSAAGSCNVAVHLAHVLEARGEFERGNGRPNVATLKMADRLLLISVLARSGHPGADECLRLALHEAPMASVAMAASGSPSLLSVLPMHGAA
ncbi:MULTISPECIES: hypothetical protein [unclassified Sphingomonas]|uniref:hypothetical protein n=1 Tax=unclassified Sphingomonas TaxID=196159 RepID=UPI002269AD77|nr:MULTISPECIES: hypothetical protein [unclassified Sphingomonas]